MFTCLSLRAPKLAVGSETLLSGPSPKPAKGFTLSCWGPGARKCGLNFLGPIPMRGLESGDTEPSVEAVSLLALSWSRGYSEPLRKTC